MPDKPKDEQEAEQTPKGLTVPVPKRDEFFGNLNKVAEPHTVYVALLVEGVDAWRPVGATLQPNGTYRLDDAQPDGEAWAFAPGSVVRCERRSLSDGDALVAVALSD
jgi:hypothetical protein